MDSDPFVLDVRLNGTDFVTGLVDSGCLCYSAINEQLFRSLRLPSIKIAPRQLEEAAGKNAEPSTVLDTVTYASIDIDGHQQKRVFFYVVPGLNYDVILGKPWLEDADVTISAKQGCLDIGASNIRAWNHKKASYKPPLMKATQVMASAFMAEVRRSRRKNKGDGIALDTGLFAVSIADIEKALKPRKRSDPKTKLPPQYHQWLKAFDHFLAEKLPPHRKGVDLHIEIEKDQDGNEKTIPWGPLYGMSREELLVLRKTLTELLDKDFIRASNSPAAAPVLMVKKPGGGIRFCVDYRGLNNITRKDRYPLPLFTETLRNVAKAKWFTKLDVIAAFHKIRVAKGEEWKTAFRTRYGLFEWRVAPFGLTGAPAAFQRYVNGVLQDYLDDFVSAYVDDILIYSSGSLQDHREKVGKVLQRLIDAGLQIDIDKCEFETKRVKYLGYIVEAEVGIRVDPEKIIAIREWATPTSVKAIRAFIGFANFYRVFIPNFSDIAEPLINLTKKEMVFHWDEACNQAFETIKELLITAPILGHFDPEKDTLVEADSSGHATGGLLLQKDKNNNWQPVAYYSKKHSPTEANYPIHDKELLAIVRCLEAWAPELRMVRKFTVLTDHKNLQYFYRERQLSERQVRWSEFLSRFDFSLEWKPGKTMGKPDALSRREQDLPANYDDERIRSRFIRLFQSKHLQSVQIQSLSSEEIDFTEEIRMFEDQDMQNLWHRSRQEDELYQELTTLVANKERNLPTKLQKEKSVSIAECTLDERGLLRFRDRIWIPDCEPLRTRIIQNIHDSHITGHPGRDLTYSILSRQFFWSGVASDVRRFVRNCEICGRNTIWRETKKGLLKPLPIPERIWGELSIDFITDLPPSGRDDATNCMVVTDRLTKGVELEGMHDISAEAVAQRLLERHYPIHGIPTAITSDRGPQFVSDLWRHFCKLLSVEQRLSTAYHPQTDGATERMNQEIEKMIRIWATYTQENWLALLPIVMGAINNREASSTGLSPFYFMHGYHNEPIQLVEDRTIQDRPKRDGEALAEGFLKRLQDATEWAQAAIAITQEKQQHQANKTRTAAPQYKEGDWVFLNLRNVKTTRPSKKLDWLHGKYKVLRQVNSHSYQLDVPGKIHPVFHVDLLRYAPNDSLPSQKVRDTQPGPILVDGDELWLVERILGERTTRQGGKEIKEAYVKWVDYTEPTWEPVSNVLKTDAWRKWRKLRAKGKGGG
ncbi:Pol protein [Pyrenophora tritici-repentis]|nr:Pol protein [Pyrenophora tritici-repentis]